jgi:NitT/TauT family transport system permease protein
MLPVLDILQSIPVLGFLPGLVLALVAVFPHSNTGLELAAVLMIFTGQVWNMTFSFYNSLRGIPTQLREAAVVCRLNWWQRVTTLELPYASMGLVWNSMMSMAGGWFFLTINEAFILGDHDFRLPGIGSYMSVAIAQGDAQAMVCAILAMALMIILVDQLFWRPIVAAVQKFKFEETETQEATGSFFLTILGRSSLVRLFLQRLWQPAASRISGWIMRQAESGRRRRPAHDPPRRAAVIVRTAAVWLLRAAALLVLAAGMVKFIALLAGVGATEWLTLMEDLGLTFARVGGAVVLGTTLMIPLGVAIGMHPRLSRLLQPVVQVAASFPAPMLFPLVILGLSMAGIGIGTGAVVLMMLGTQWYILFNVVAGAMAIPQELREAADVARLTRLQNWRRLILPGIFPSLVTGWVTATGGAWNASIVAEYVHFGDHLLVATGLGSTITTATDQANFPVLAAGVFAMAGTVVLVNRLLWRKLYRKAEERFSLNT